MPYFISDQADGCAGWATLKEDGEVIGCHTTKADAIAQMVAVSLAEGLKPAGQRDVHVSQIVVSDIDGTISDSGDPITGVISHLQDVDAAGIPVYIVTARNADDRATTTQWLVDNDVPHAELIMSSGGDATAYKVDVAQRLLAADHDIVEWIENNPQTRSALAALGINVKGPSAFRELPTAIEARAISAPQWLQDNANRGLEWLREGYAGDGLTEKTKAEARAMAAGTVSDDKVVRMAAWFARHMADLEGTDRNTDPPTAGMVAHALWGGWPIDESRRAMRWAEDNSASRQLPRMTGARMATKVETRQILVDQLEVRDTGAGMSFSGYAAVFNSPSEPLPWTETIRQGAFGRSLRAKNNVMMLWSHDTSQPLASTRSKTMTLAEDSKGLLVDAALPQTSLGRVVSELLRSKVVDSMSFGFSVPAGGDIWSADGQTRELTSIRLHEVSVVSFPAYPKTSASVRSIDILSDKTGADAESLSAALDALEAGNSLTRDQATMLTTVVEKLAPEAEAVPELLEDNIISVTLARLRDELDLNFKTL